MYILNLKKIMNNKLTVIIFSLLTIVIVLALVIYTLNFKTNIFRGSKIANIFGLLDEKENILNMESYYAEYEVTVISNKNTNTYKMKEWYKKNIGSKFEYLDSNSDRVTILIKDNKLVISNDNQKNVMKVDPYVTSYTNLLSISTFVDMFNESSNTSCCFTANSYKKGKNINMILDNTLKENCNCKYSKIAEIVNKIELKIDINTNIPLTYIVYDKDKKESLCIVYNKFNINKNIDNKVFKI